jgi:hypothetical protein
MDVELHSCDCRYFDRVAICHMQSLKDSSTIICLKYMHLTTETFASNVELEKIQYRTLTENGKGLVKVINYCVDCQLILRSNDEIVNIYGNENCCCTFVGIVAVGTEIVIISNAVESNGFKGGVERWCPFESRLWKSI